MNYSDNYRGALLGFSLPQATPAQRLGVARNWFEEAFARLGQWRQLSRSRRDLSELDEYQLRDIGLSRSQAVFESGKSFWHS